MLFFCKSGLFELWLGHTPVIFGRFAPQGRVLSKQWLRATVFQDPSSVSLQSRHWFGLVSNDRRLLCRLSWVSDILNSGLEPLLT